MATRNLDRVAEKIGKGVLIDTQVWNDDSSGQDGREVDMYMKTLVLKYPIIAGVMNKSRKQTLSTSLLAARSLPMPRLSGQPSQSPVPTQQD